MIAFALASWLTTQTWEWDRMYGGGVFTDPDRYRIYWQAGTPTHWCPTNFVEFQTAAACDDVVCQGDIPEPPASPGQVVYINITALNAAGESAWDHGAKDGACP